MNSWQYQVIKGILKLPLHPFISKRPNIKRLRKLFDFSSSFLPMHHEVTCVSMAMNSVSCCLFTPHHGLTSCVLLYLHGGAYVMGSAQTHQSFLSHLSAETKMHIYAPNYRLAPEHPFPAALNDIETCYCWLAQRHANIIVAGESAGGGLTMALLLKLKQPNLSPFCRYPVAGVVISPWLDLGLTGASLKLNQKKDKLIPVKTLPCIVNSYLQGADPFDPLASPLYGDLCGLPPLFLQAAVSEVLFSDTERFANKAQEAGVKTVLDIEADHFHAWPFLSRFLPEAQHSVKKIAHFTNTVASSLSPQSI